MTREEFTAIMLGLEIATGKRFAEMQVEGKHLYQLDAYWDLLGDLPAEVLATAVRLVLLESPYPTLPTIGALRQRALDLMQPPALQAMEAWGLVYRAINRYSDASEALATLPELARRAALALGWQALCDTTTEQLPTVRAQFRDAYNLMASRSEREALPPARYQRQVLELVAGLTSKMRIEMK